MTFDHPGPRTTRLLVAGLAACATALSWHTAPAAADPAGVPSTATAREQLETLTVDAEGSMSGYSRDRFPHWSPVEGACNTRESVLQRDGDSVVTDDSCAAVSGTWHSTYDDKTWTDPADVDIDHVVPLAEAWRSGAAGWTDERREQFANDLVHPQLIAVTDDVNQAKGDQDPAAWQPPVTSYRCTYAKMWITVKHSWQLSLQQQEQSALRDMLDSCTS